MTSQPRYSSPITRSFRQTISPPAPATATGSRQLWLIGVISLFWGGCATDKPSGIMMPAAPPRAESMPFPTILLSADSRPASFHFDKASGQKELVADGAGTAAGDLLAKSTSEPLVNVAVSAGTLVLSPFVAAHGAITARQRLSQDKLAAAETVLTASMQEMAQQARFHQYLLPVANRQRPGQLVEPPQDLDRALMRAGAVLDARIEELRLERSNASDTSYRLRIKARTRLVRADGTVLYDQPAEYCSETGLFLDWTRYAAFQSVAETGYRALAQHFAEQLVIASEKPLLIGAGYKRRLTRSPDTHFVGSPSRSVQPSTLPITARGTLGIYSTASVTHVQLQRPQTRGQAHADAMDDVEWMLDGMNNHPNMIVMTTAATAAVPISLWKQTAAAVRGLSPRTLRQAEATMMEAASHTQPHQELAFELAQQLTPQTSQRVMLVKKPLPFGGEQDPVLLRCLSHGTLAWLPEGQTAGRYLTSQGADTGLEIHVLSARLHGRGGINPKLALCVEARATVVRPGDDRSFFSRPVSYRSQERTFTEWAAHDAKAFRDELQNCYRNLSAAMADQLLQRGLIPGRAQPPATLASTRPAKAQ